MASPARLLIVEDEAQLVSTLSSYLRAFPGEFEITAAATGEEALAILESHPVDLLLTDVRLPGLDGTEVVRRALELQPGMRVVVMTAFSSRALRSRVLRDGALHFVEKPFDLPELRQLLLSAASSETGWTGSMRGLDLFDLTQLLLLVRKTRTVLVKAGRREGRLAFVAGEIHHASTGELSGPEAFYEMVTWDGGAFGDLPDEDATALPRNVEMPGGHLMMEAARRRDERMRAALAPEPEAATVARGAEAGLASLAADAGDQLFAFVGANPFARYAAVLDDAGAIVAATAQPPEQLADLAAWFAALEQRAGSALGRVLLEDQAGTVVLSPRRGGHRLLVVAQAEVPLAVVTQGVQGLEGKVFAAVR